MARAAQHTLGGSDPQALECLRVTQRQLDQLADAPELGFQSGNVFVARGLAGSFGLPCRSYQQSGRGVDHHRPLGYGGDHPEVGRPVAEEGGANAIPAVDGQAIQ